jgi:hypothetical protein
MSLYSAFAARAGKALPILAVAIALTAVLPAQPVGAVGIGGVTQQPGTAYPDPWPVLETVGPDLVVGATYTGSGNAYCNQWDTVGQCKQRILRVSVANLGSRPSVATTVSIRGSIFCQSCASSLEFPSLAAGTQVTRWTSVVVPSNCWTISLNVDPANSVAELNENNNFSAIGVC